MARKTKVVESPATEETITFDSCLERLDSAEKRLSIALKAMEKAEKAILKAIK